MKLVKVSECVNRTFDGEASTDEVTQVNYDVVENENIVGNANISNNYFSINVSISETMDEIRAKVEAMFA